MGSYHFRCMDVLGRGSFGEVWSAEIVAAPNRDERQLPAALKDITACDQAAVDQALFEIKLLSELHGPDMCMPRLLAHRVAGRRIRIAMTRVPGETLESFMSRPQPRGLDGLGAVRRGGALATLLLRQLGPTLERVSHLAWHRDVNPRNVLLSDDAGGLMDSRESSVSSARFWLIDFGLAVDSKTWSSKWATSPISGDCRYWPVSSWLMWLRGPEAVRGSRRWLRQYESRLDSYALGVMALDLLCTPALAALDPSKTGPEDELRGSWRRLLTAYSKYMRDVSRWHHEIFRVFSAGGAIGPLHRKLSQERVVEVVHDRVSTICSCLRACVDRTHDPAIQNLLWATAELLDESSEVALTEAVSAVCSDGRYQPGSGTGDGSRTSALRAASLDSMSARTQGCLPSLAPVSPRERCLTTRQRSESARRNRPSSHAACIVFDSNGQPSPQQPALFVPPLQFQQDIAEASFAPPVVRQLCFSPQMAHRQGRQSSPSPVVVRTLHGEGC